MNRPNFLPYLTTVDKRWPKHSCERRESRAAARRRSERRRRFLCERRRRRRIQSAMRAQPETQLRASGIARRRTEKELAEASFPLRATTTAADSKRDARAA